MTEIDQEFIAAFDEEFIPQCERLDEIAEGLIEGTDNPSATGEAFRIYHTIKGNALSVGLNHLGTFVHCAEEVLRVWRDGDHPPTADLGTTMLRVDDELRRLRANPESEPQSALMSWLSSVQPSASDATPLPEPESAPPSKSSSDSSPAGGDADNNDGQLEVTVGITELDQLFREAEDLRSDLIASGDNRRSARMAQVARRMLSIRTKPVRSLLPRLKRMVRETAANLQREVDLVISGENAAADAAVVKDLSGALPHLLRNGLDHGIEAPADREAANKPRRARLELSFRFEGGSFIVRVSEDGRGMDDRLIAKSAVNKGLLTADDAQALTRYERLNLIFRPGFSTAAAVSTVSGRGVGMDAVAAIAARHGGRIDIETTLGAGSTFDLVFPVPYRFDDYLLATLNQRTIGLPVSMIQRLVVADNHTPIVEDGMVTIDGEALVVVGFKQWDPAFGAAAARPLIILKVGDMRAAMAVDGLLGFTSALVQGFGNSEAPPFVAGIGRIEDGHFWAIDDGKLSQDWNAFTVPFDS